MDILDELRNDKKLPAQLRMTEHAIAMVWRLTSLAADEIEALKAENTYLRNCACSDCNQEVLQLRDELERVRRILDEIPDRDIWLAERSIAWEQEKK